MTPLEQDGSGLPRSKSDWRLGEIAVHNELLGQTQLDECLAIQREMADMGFAVKIGKILVERFYLERVSLVAILRAQAVQRRVGPEDIDLSIGITKFTPAENEDLLRRVREDNVVEPGMLERVIQVQAQLGGHGMDKQVGELVVELALVSADLVRDVLAGHQPVRPGLFTETMAQLGPGQLDGSREPRSRRLARRLTEKDLRFGQLARQKGLIDRAVVEEALALQFLMKELGILKKTGEILVLQGRMEKPDVGRVLQLQKRRLSRISWVDLAQLGPVPEGDRELVDHLVHVGVVESEQIDECRYVQRFMADLGIDRALGDVLVDKEYLEPEIIAGIRKEQARRKESPAAEPEEGPVQVGAYTLRSSALEDAYRQILQEIGPEERDPDVPGSTPALRTRRPTARAVACRPLDRSARRPVWIALAAGLLPVLFATGYLFLHAAGERGEKAAATERERREREDEIERVRKLGDEDADLESRQDRQAFVSIDKMRRILEAHAGVTARVQSQLESIFREGSPALAEGPYAADAAMLLGRAAFRRVAGRDFRLVGQDQQRVWVEQAIEILGRARKLYRRAGGGTVFGGDFPDAVTGRPVRVRLVLPEEAPELFVYAEIHPPYYDHATRAIDYRSRADVASSDVDLLVQELKRIAGEIGR